MGACTSSLTSEDPPSLPPFPDYTGAGILFAEGPVALAGIQKYWRVAKGGPAVLSGFGGRREDGDSDWLATAWREVIEELFHITTVPAPLLQALRSAIPLPIPPHTTYTSGYVILYLGFRHLETALGLCKTHGLQSDLYKAMPSSVLELILLRGSASQAEVGPLALLPTAHRAIIAEDFQGDLSYCRQTLLRP